MAFGHTSWMGLGLVVAASTAAADVVGAAVDTVVESSCDAVESS